MSDEHATRLLQEAIERRYSRREVIKRGAALGLSMPVIGMVLAACGGAASPTAATGGGAQPAATTATGGGSPVAAGGRPAAGGPATRPAGGSKHPLRGREDARRDGVRLRDGD